MTDRTASDRLRFGVCDCEYPCSCCELDGVRYGSWTGALDALGAEVDRLREALGRIARRSPGDCCHPDHMQRLAQKALGLPVSGALDEEDA